MYIHIYIYICTYIRVYIYIYTRTHTHTHTHTYIYIYIYKLIDQVVRVLANSLGDLGSVPGCVIPKTLKVVLDNYLLNTQQYKVRIKVKVEQSWEMNCALPSVM